MISGLTLKVEVIGQRSRSRDKKVFYGTLDSFKGCIVYLTCDLKVTRVKVKGHGVKGHKVKVK